MKSFRTEKGTELPIISLKGKPYLQVAHRIVWFREEHPDWSIETTIYLLNEKVCVTRAEIKDITGRVLSTSHKTETPQGFPDYVEKAETGAIGRALALLGYGTQFTDDLDEGERLADAPVAPAKKAAAPPVNQAAKFHTTNGVISHSQRERLVKIVETAQWEDEDVIRVLKEAYGVSSSKELKNFDYQEMCNAIAAGSTPNDIIKAKKG